MRKKIFIALNLVFLFFVSSCSVMDVASDLWSDNKYYYKSGHERVQIHSESDEVKNIHPIKVDHRRLEGALNLILLKYSKKTEPMFSDKKVGKFSIAISEALEEAKSHQDVIFVLEDWYTDKWLKHNRVSSGRIFYNRSGLNIIFGSILREGSQQDDPMLAVKNPDLRKNPYVPGSRFLSIKNPYYLATVPNSGVFRPKSAKGRLDWLVFTNQALRARSSVNESEKKMAFSSNIEVQGLRSEVQKLRQELQSMRGSPQRNRYAPNYYPPNYQMNYPVPNNYPYGYYNQQYRNYYPQPQPQQQQYSNTQGKAQLTIKSLENMRARGLISEENYLKKIKELGY